MLKIKKSRNVFTGLFATVLLLLAPVQSKAAKEQPNSNEKTCTFGTISSAAIPLSINMDDRKQDIDIFTRYVIEEKPDNKKLTSVNISKISAVVFEDFLKIYNNFLKKRVGPKEYCDKLEIGKVQVETDNNGKLNGYFVGRYEDRWCLYLKFFESTPGETSREMFVLSSSKGITGVKNIFRPVVINGEFNILTESIYEPIEEPSIFGRGEATLSGLYKRPLEGLLSGKEFQEVIKNLLPEINSGKNKKGSGFKILSVGFITNTENKIQLTFLSQRKMTRNSACAFREHLLKNKNWKEKKIPQK